MTNTVRADFLEKIKSLERKRSKLIQAKNIKEIEILRLDVQLDEIDKELTESLKRKEALPDAEQ